MNKAHLDKSCRGTVDVPTVPLWVQFRLTPCLGGHPVGGRATIVGLLSEKAQLRNPPLLTGVLAVSPTPLLVLAPYERRSEDQNFSKQTTHLFLLQSREPEKRPELSSPGWVSSVETFTTDHCLHAGSNAAHSDPLDGSTSLSFRTPGAPESRPSPGRGLSCRRSTSR